MSEERISFVPLGTVRNQFDYPAQGKDIREHPSRLEIRPAYQAGLTGAAPGQKLLVIFHFHRAGGEAPLIQHPRGDRSREPRGVFLLRSPHRPNPLGVTEVEVKAVEKDGLTVTGLDAVNGTPILDLKIVDFGKSS